MSLFEFSLFLSFFPRQRRERESGRTKRGRGRERSNPSSAPPISLRSFGSLPPLPLQPTREGAKKKKRELRHPSLQKKNPSLSPLSPLPRLKIIPSLKRIRRH